MWISVHKQLLHNFLKITHVISNRVTFSAQAACTRIVLQVDGFRDHGYKLVSSTAHL